MTFNRLITEFTLDFSSVVEVGTDNSYVGSTLDNTEIRGDLEDVRGTIVIERNTIISPFLVIEGNLKGKAGGGEECWYANAVACILISKRQ